MLKAKAPPRVLSCSQSAQRLCKPELLLMGPNEQLQPAHGSDAAQMYI